MACRYGRYCLGRLFCGRSFGCELCLHLENRDISVSLPYEGTAALLLEDPRFLECHHRILVNMDMIASMGKEDFVLKNGAKVPISHR